jgi:hypothetical protein
MQPVCQITAGRNHQHQQHGQSQDHTLSLAPGWQQGRFLWRGAFGQAGPLGLRRVQLPLNVQPRRHIWRGWHSGWHDSWGRRLWQRLVLVGARQMKRGVAWLGRNWRQPPARRRLELSALFREEVQRLNQAVNGFFVGRAVDPSLQRPNGIFPNVRKLSQFCLRQTSCDAVATEQRTKV